MNQYNLPDGYQERLKPQYFQDVLDNADLWQADVYNAADKLAADFGVFRMVDVGCGRAGKLLKRAGYMETIGIDYGDNIHHLQATYPHADWLEADLEHEIIPPELFLGSVVVCADVIEHLINPTALLWTLHNALETADFVVLSTPDRERMYGGIHKGPPSNLAHVREWTLKELCAWLSMESFPINWAGWTVSFAPHTDKRNTSIVVMSKLHPEGLDLPMCEEGLAWMAQSANPPIPEQSFMPTSTPLPLQTKPIVPPIEVLLSPVHAFEPERDHLLKVWMTPTPKEAALDITNAINQIVVRVNEYLPEYGVQLVEQPDQAAIFAGHAGQGSQAPIHVAHYHGLYNTAQGSDNYAINREVIKNLKTALVVTAPSQWIADVIRRDMHLDPRIIGWGVDVDEWSPDKPAQPPYVIWNKARVDNISNPQPMLDLARMAHDVLFLTTFGNGTPNVKTIGRQPYEVMKQYVRHASVYLSTNVETFGIGLMEAMSAGVPVLSFRQGAQEDYIMHGVNGFLAEPGDMEGLHKGLRYCLEHRERLGINARATAQQYTWRRVASHFAGIYFEVDAMLKDVRPHRIDPSLYSSNLIG